MRGMKRWLVGLVAVSAMAVCVTGCKITDGQAKVIARNAGLYSAVGWIALDNPSSNVVASVVQILDVIEKNAADVQGGATYTDVLYPIVVTYVDTKVELQYRPVCKAGAIAILGGIDMLFVTYPSWVEDQDLAIGLVDAFIVGAKSGFAMKENNPVMVQARKNARARMKVYIPSR